MLDTKMLDTQEIVLNNHPDSINDKNKFQNSPSLLLGVTAVLTVAVCLQTMNLLQGPMPMLVLLTLSITALSYFYSLRASFITLSLVSIGYLAASYIPVTTLQLPDISGSYFGQQAVIALVCATLATYSRILRKNLRIQEKLKYFAQTHDDLTLLLNKDSFIDKLDHIIEASPKGEERFALVLIDIKGLNKINKEHGFKAGNSALHIISERLRQVAKKDDLVARIEDGCFALVVRKMAHNAQLSGYISRVNAILNLPFHYAWTEISLETRVASSFYPIDGKTASDLLELNSQKLNT